MHWYVYHSRNAMRHTYASLGRSLVYSTKRQTKLCLGHYVWVIEGTESNPAAFSLVDCFKVTETDIPPFPPGYDQFQLKAAGDKSLLSGEIPLDAATGWFKDLHGRYITKQKFFHNLREEPAILEGLRATSGVAI